MAAESNTETLPQGLLPPSIPDTSDGTNSVTPLFPGSSGQGIKSCQWSISYYTTTNTAFNSGNKCLIGVSNSKWSGCCGLTRWHGFTTPIGSTTSSAPWGRIYGSSSNTYYNNSDYSSSYTISSGRTWGCLNPTTPAYTYSGCATNEHYVACK